MIRLAYREPDRDSYIGRWPGRLRERLRACIYEDGDCGEEDEEVRTVKLIPSQCVGGCKSATCRKITDQRTNGLDKEALMSRKRG